MPARIITKYGRYLFIGFLLIGLYFMTWIDTPYNAAFFWGFKYLSLPIVALVVSFVWYYHAELIAAAKRPSQVYVTTFIMCIFLAPFSGPYASFVNILFGSHPLVIFRGQVTNKSVVRGRHSHDYVVTILTDEENKPMKFKVSSAEFSELDLGSHFSRTMKIGCLGIPYRLKW
jgi:hypothetical protein